MAAAGTVLLDLDGTLTDSREGILKSVAHAMAEVGVPMPEPPHEWMIGPPIHGTLAGLVGPDKAAAAVAAYRDRYLREGQYENRLYPGIPAMLDRLVQQGFRLIVATSKLRQSAVAIVEHFGIAGRLDAVHGSEADGTRSAKAELIAYILEQERVDARSAVMVGDRRFDVIGAAAHGLPTIGVLYGFGDREELTESGAAALADSPADVARLAPELVGSKKRVA